MLMTPTQYFLSFFQVYMRNVRTAMKMSIHKLDTRLHHLNGTVPPPMPLLRMLPMEPVVLPVPRRIPLVEGLPEESSSDEEKA